MAKKNNSKSVRLSDEVLSYIENYEGDGFNQKFENIILYAMKTEDERKSRIQFYDDLIDDKSSVLDRLREYERLVERLGYSLKQADAILENLIDK